MVKRQAADPLQSITAESADLSFLFVAPENMQLIFPVYRARVNSGYWPNRHQTWSDFETQFDREVLTLYASNFHSR